MDMRSWKKVLLQWITECGFMERNYFNIEQTDIDIFYKNFSAKHQATANNKCKRLADFVKKFYPSFEIHFDDENCLSSADYIYVYSLLLHFCCVKNPETVFHEICQRLPDFDQQCIAGFFKKLLDAEPVTKEALRHAIAEVGNIEITPPRLNDSFSCNVTNASIGGYSSASPLKTPKHSAQRISPSTPKSYLLEERTRELYNLRAQLETERYEKGLLEVQLNQSEDEILKLNNDHKKLLQQIQDLKNDIYTETSDGSSNHDGEENQIQKRILKELSQKEQEILELSHNLRTLREEKSLVKKNLSYREKEMILCMNRVKELELKVEELTDEIKEKDIYIKYLANSKIELEQFIAETRSSGANPDSSTSGDCLDSSFLRNSNNSNGSNINNSPENLGVSVIDVQLREKEHENQLLKDKLKNVKEEHKRLEKDLIKLTQEYDSPIDTISIISSEDPEPYNNKEQSNEETSFEELIRCEDKFNIFSSCIEKIFQFRKIEKEKIEQLECQTSGLLEKNKELTRKLEQVTIEIKEGITIKEKLQQELAKSKEEVELVLQRSRNDILEAEKQKTKLYIEVQSMQRVNEQLNENIQQLKTKLELQQEESKELLSNNKKLKENEQNLQIELKEQYRVISNKTFQWEEELKTLNEQLTKQFADIEHYKQTEKIIKSNYEQMVVQNQEFKKESRQANNHLCAMKNDLNEKEKELISLGKDITDITQKNEMLEKNISSLMKEHEKELLSSNTAQMELDEQLGKLKNRLAKIELLMASKHHECELKQRCLEEVKMEIKTILKLLSISNDANNDDDILNTIKKLKPHIQNMLDSNKDLNIKNVNLQETHRETLIKVEQLSQQLNEKSQEFEKNQEKLLLLRAENLDGEKKIAELQQQQLLMLEKIKRDLQKKELELHERLEEATLEYEASMERIGVELKSEKEHHNNKEMELILSKAEYNETKKKLNEAEKEIEKLYNDKQQLEENCERLKQFEIRVIECSDENNKLRHEIETFKQQLTQNALRVLEADKALAEFMELTKENYSDKSEVQILQNKLKEKEQSLMDIELKLQEQSVQKDEIKQLKLHLNKQNALMSSMQKQVDNLRKENEEKDQQILKEQQKKSSDELKLAVEEKQQVSYLQQKLQDLKEDINSLTLQNTRLHGDLVEREAELSLTLDEQQQEKEDFQQQLDLQTKNLADKTEQLKHMDTALMEIAVIMENNFNLSQETLQKDVSNVFNCQDNETENNILKLKKHLNLILFKQQKLNKELQEIIVQKEEAVASMAILKDNNNELMSQLSQQEKILKATQEQLEKEELIVENRAFLEVKRLEEDLLNLEKVNERLANENIKIQASLGNVEQELQVSKLKVEALDVEVLQLKEEIHNKSLVIEKLQRANEKLNKTMKEKCQQIEKLEKSKNFEVQLKDKTVKLQNLEKEYQEAKEKAHKNQQKLSHYQLINQTQQTEIKKLQEKFKFLQTSNDSLEEDLGNKNKEILAMKNKNSDVLQHNKYLDQQLNLTSKKLEEMVTNKLNAEAKCDQLQSKIYQLQRDIDFIKAQQHSQQEENTRLNLEIESLKVDKQHLRDEINENKISLQRANENVSQLIQQIASIRLEKEAALDESRLLRKQLEETDRTQTSSETKMKSVTEKSQDLERKLFSAENEVKSLKDILEKSECSAEKLQLENKKLRDSQEASTKRIEKLALKLGDSQARSNKLERENEKIGKTLEAHTATVEALQKEKDFLQTEAKSLKERLSRAERGHEQLTVKVKNLEHLNTSLQQVKQKLEASEIDSKTKLNKLEKMREINEEKIRKLTNSLDNAENANVKLNLEIGALNSQLQEVKVDHNQERSCQIEELNHKLIEAQELHLKYNEINEKLKTELNCLKEENILINDKLSKASLSLQIATQKCERFATDMEQLRAEMLIMRQEKMQIELQHETCIQKINQFESQNAKISYENKNLVKNFQQKIDKLEQELAAKSKKLVDLEKETELLKERSQLQSSLTQQNTTTNLTELEDLRAKISLAENMRVKDQEIISQLRLDNQILHTKYQESKQRLLDAAKLSEERIKENRLELEGKLEKMKNKMESPNSLDDSMSALLSTTAGGTRKKCSGVTHYKRPGPPTPSKNGGRLSFGSSSEPAREILKETYDVNGGSAVSSSKTPARFNFFVSRFSMGNTRDEKLNSVKGICANSLQKVIQKPKNKDVATTRRLLVGVGYTSTPRKSKVHYDQRRLLDQLLTSSTSPSPLTINNEIVKKEKKKTPPDISFIKTPLTALERQEVCKAPMHKTIAKRLEAIAGGIKRCRRNSTLFGRRLSRRVQEICTPTSGETTSTASSTPAVIKDKTKRKIVVVSSSTTSESVSKTTLLQRRLRKKHKREKGARPSLCLRGNIFAKYRTPNKRAIHDLNRYKSRKQRMEHFNRCRNIKSFKSKKDEDLGDKTINCRTVKDVTFDLKNNNNNNYATFNQNKLLRETVVIGKNIPKKQELVEEQTFTFGEEQFELNPDDFDYSAENYYSENQCSDEEISRVENEKFGSTFKLVTTQDLEEFDHFIANTNAETKIEKYGDDYSSQGSSGHFEKLLIETESNAPFEIKHIQFNTTKISNSNRSSNSQCSSFLSNSHPSLQSQMDSQNSQGNSSIATATPHLSPIKPTCQYPRTIYGGTIIYNHRLPIINTTYVRKSSIYIKNRKRSSYRSLETSSCNDVVLITNQTITFVDIMRMWSQMDSSTRIIISFAILASVITLLGLFVSFCSRR